MRRKRSRRGGGEEEKKRGNEKEIIVWMRGRRSYMEGDEEGEGEDGGGMGARR